MPRWIDKLSGAVQRASAAVRHRERNTGKVERRPHPTARPVPPDVEIQYTPQIDGDPDPGVSRRHAQISPDGTRWWIEDLESANGTFVAPSAGQLPSMPIGRGRVEFAPDQRLYLGGWTRLVIRRATEDEQQAFAS